MASQDFFYSTGAMRIVRTGEMRGIDKRAVKEYGIPSLLLMENAGRGVAETIEEYLPVRDVGVLCVCGKGNNGGDGFVVARHLANSGAEVQVLLLGKIEDLKGDALTNARIAKKSGIAVAEVSRKEDLKPWFDNASNFQVAIDGIFGTGFKGSPKGLPASGIKLLNQCTGLVVSIDLPSGIEADGMVKEPELAIQADLTVTMAYLKPCHLLYPTRSYCGDVWIADIGIPSSIIDTEGRLRLATEDNACLLLPERKPWGHKGTFGKVLVVAGSRGMTGAARMAAMAATRAGAGLTFLGFPQTLSDVFDASLLETVKRPLPDTGDGHLGNKAAEVILGMVDEVEFLAIGPGLGLHPETVEAIQKVVTEWKKPMLIDADGLNALAGNPEILEGKKPEAVITPHPGELARLIRGNPAEIDRRRLDITEEMAKKWNLVLVLKGAPTIIGSPADCWVNSTGNSGLASGGTGDVLTGLVSGLAAQGIPLAHAARLGVFLHGKAADIGTEEMGEYSLAAGDLLYYLPEAFNSLLKPPDEDYAEE